MQDYKIIEGEPTLGEGRLGIALSRFNGFIGDRLLEGAVDVLERHGISADRVDVVRVPGAFELPLAIKAMAVSGRYVGIIALGAVIRGDTPHFEYVAGECVKGISQVGYQFDLPVGFGVLTVDTSDQAAERACAKVDAKTNTKTNIKADAKGSNKGAEAAMAVVEMVNLLAKLRV
ncbi:MAG TPA: 6,7-dimethyl-8-ribityllumazine synthase [Acidiferrobacteraceae bacterium]|nr:6,7-dimethyl-8-ribityllumazine synthase [Acidiferrobacteraceae bacterium]